MSVPAPVKTYEIDVFSYYTGSTVDIDDDNANQRLLLIQKDMWQGQTHHGYAGTINEITAGVTYELVATNRSGLKLNNEAGAFNIGPSIVGKKIEITGATSGGNNGFFIITAVINATTVRYTNATGVAEAFSGNYRVSNGKFTARGGAFPAWVCKGSSAGSTGKGAGMDGRDRWHTKADMQLSSTVVGNHSWFVLQNTQNGVEIRISNNLATVFRRVQGDVSCEIGYTGGSTTTDPACTDSFRFSGDTGVNNGYWFITDSWFGVVLQLIFIHSTDGKQDFMIVRRSGVNQGLLSTGIAGAPETAGTIPWPGNHAYVIWPDGRARNQAGTPHLNFAEFNDNARCNVTIDKNVTIIQASGYLSSPFMIAASPAEYWPTGYEPVGKDFAAERIGLVLATVGVRGRVAYVPDMFWAADSETLGAGQGDSFPAGGTRQWLKFGTFYIPWNGTLFEPK